MKLTPLLLSFSFGSEDFPKMHDTTVKFLEENDVIEPD